jgi:transglutaminase-like putative cysteine protease
VTAYRDSFGNWCTRIVAPKGRTRVSADAIVNDSGAPDAIVRDARQLPVENLPEETLLFLLGSRYCETDRLSEIAWNLFGQAPTGWDRVQAICDYVHGHITFGYQHARMTRTALEAFYDQTGVCRDYAHLAVAFCRCMNIPRATAPATSGHRSSAAARHDGLCRVVRGFLDGHVAHVRCAQQRAAHRPRADRAGRDASDVAISSTFGPNTLASFKFGPTRWRPLEPARFCRRSFRYASFPGQRESAAA